MTFRRPTRIELAIGTVCVALLVGFALLLTGPSTAANSADGGKTSVSQGPGANGSTGANGTPTNGPTTGGATLNSSTDWQSNVHCRGQWRLATKLYFHHQRVRTVRIRA